MTKKIIWRLKESPTPETLGNLVRNEILTKEEAREILFNQVEESDRDVESLKSEIKFLRELVEKLSNRSQIVEIIKEVPTYKRYEWYKPYEIWCQNDNKVYYATTANSSNVDMTQNWTSKIACNFSNISTF